MATGSGVLFCPGVVQTESNFHDWQIKVIEKCNMASKTDLGHAITIKELKDKLAAYQNLNN